MSSFEPSACGCAEAYQGAVDVAVALLGEGLDGLDGRGLAVRLGDVEGTIRRLEAVAASIVSTADRQEVFRDDGHASVRGWVKASVRMSNRTAIHRVRTARLCAELPECHAALAGGLLGVDQVRELARVFANPRCGPQLDAVLEPLVDLAASATFEAFAARVRGWAALADADGAHRSHEEAHAGRTARMALVGTEGYLDARMGSIQFAAMKEVLERFTQAEFEAEWEDLRAQHGEDACPGMLPRTEGQRRADALAAIFQRAAASAPDAKEPEPVLNLVVDEEVYEAQLEAMVRGEPARFTTDDLAARHCRTTGGIPIDPADAVAASVIGHVRRVVLDGDGRIIDLGRRRRLFTGGAREAALLQAVLDNDGRCIWPGCGHLRCQIDHSVGWTSGGATNPANAGPLCPRHNRFKTRGYRCWRDPTGTWHTIRPDGTEILAA